MSDRGLRGLVLRVPSCEIAHFLALLHQDAAAPSAYDGKRRQPSNRLERPDAPLGAAGGR